MKEISNRVVSNSLSIYAGKSANLLITFFVFIHIANYLGKSSFGILSVAITFVATFDIISNFGLNQIVVRELAKDDKPQAIILSSGILLKILLSIIAWLLSSILVILFYHNREIILAVWLISFNLFISSKLSSTRTIFESFYQARLKMIYPMLFNFVDNLLFAILIFLSTYQYKTSLIGIALIYTISNLPGTIFLLVDFFKKVKITYSFNWQMINFLFLESVPLAFYLFFSILNTKVDILLLSWFRDETEVGLFSAATRLVYPLFFLSTSITISLFPLLSGYFATNKAQFNKTFKFGIKIILLISIFLVIILLFNADKIILTFYIKSYASAILPFKILILTLGFSFLNFFFVDLLISIYKQKLTTIVLAISLIVNVCFNLLLIPKIGFIGASYVRLLTAFVTFILFTYILFFKLGIELSVNFIRIGLLLISFGAVAVLLRPLHLFVAAGIEMITFPIFIYILRYFSREEVLLIKSHFKSLSKLK